MMFSLLIILIKTVPSVSVEGSADDKIDITLTVDPTIRVGTRQQIKCEISYPGNNWFSGQNTLAMVIWRQGEPNSYVDPDNLLEYIQSKNGWNGGTWGHTPIIIAIYNVAGGNGGRSFTLPLAQPSDEGSKYFADCFAYDDNWIGRPRTYLGKYSDNYRREEIIIVPENPERTNSIRMTEQLTPEQSAVLQGASTTTGASTSQAGTPGEYLDLMNAAISVKGSLSNILTDDEKKVIDNIIMTCNNEILKAAKAATQ
jgi:hypothetical protein